MSVDIWRPPATVEFQHRGRLVELIPIGPPHRDLLRSAFERLSERSRYLRFMAPVPALSAAELRHLTELDMVDRFAWGLLCDGEPVAVGRYARTTTDPSAVEVGLTVLDDYQGLGFGTLLVEALAVVAAHNGFRNLHFEVLAENEPMLAILRRMGASMVSDRGVVHAELAVAEVPPPPVEPDLLLDAVGAARRSLAT
jgi:GNAT superfamily N-acetyltransferase